MPGLLDDIGEFLDHVPALGDMPMGEYEYVDYAVLPAPEKKKTATAGLLRFLPFVLSALFVFFVLRGKK